MRSRLEWIQLGKPEWDKLEDYVAAELKKESKKNKPSECKITLHYVLLRRQDNKSISVVKVDEGFFKDSRYKLIKSGIIPQYEKMQ
mgnify:CR=1 FL=1